MTLYTSRRGAAIVVTATIALALKMKNGDNGDKWVIKKNGDILLF